MDVKLTVISLFLLLLGTFGNIMTLVVLNQRRFKNMVSAVYLQFLTIVDLFALYTGLLRKFVFFLLNVDIRDSVPEICAIHKWLTYASLHCSAWIRIAFTMQRISHTWMPQKAHLEFTRSKVRICLVVLIFVILAINSHILYGNRPGLETENNITKRVCVFTNDKYLFFFDKYWSIIDFALYSAIPTVLMITGNILIIFRVLKSKRNMERKSAFSESRSASSESRASRFSSMTIMLIVLNICYVIFTSPSGIFIVGYQYWYTEGQEETLLQVFDILHLMLYVDNSTNFVLYCLTGSLFRNEALAVFSNVCKCERKDNENVRNLSMS